MKRFEANIYVVVGVAIILLAILPMFLSRAGIALATEICAVLAIAMMWNLLAGFAGIVFIGVPLFVGIGGYTLYVAANWLAIPAYPVVFLGGLVSAIVAIIISPLLFRLNGAQLAIGSWVMAEIARLAVLLTPSLGGGGGLNLEVVRMVKRAWRMPLNYYTCALTLAVALLLTAIVMRSKLGLALRSIRDSQFAAEAMGINVSRVKLIILAASAFVTGLAGAAYYITTLQVSAGSAFSMNWTAMVIFIVLLGGIGSIEGPIIGAAVYFLLRETLADLGTGYFIISGALAVIVTIFLPGGFSGLLRNRAGIVLMPINHRPGKIPGEQKA